MRSTCISRLSPHQKFRLLVEQLSQWPLTPLLPKLAFFLLLILRIPLTSNVSVRILFQIKAFEESNSFTNSSVCVCACACRGVAVIKTAACFWFRGYSDSGLSSCVCRGRCSKATLTNCRNLRRLQTSGKDAWIKLSPTGHFWTVCSILEPQCLCDFLCMRVFPLLIFWFNFIDPGKMETLTLLLIFLTVSGSSFVLQPSE